MKFQALLNINNLNSLGNFDRPNSFQTEDNSPAEVPVIFQAGKKERSGRDFKRFPLALVFTSHNLMRTLNKNESSSGYRMVQTCATVIRAAESSFMFSTAVCFGGFNYN